MKKSTGSILLLSAFAAMVLAGCGKGGDSSSTPATGSSDTAVQTSADETSAPEGTSEAGTSAAGTSAAGTSAAGTSTASSSAAASSAASSSSTPAVETDWSQKSFIGEYKGGMNNLIINTDKTTSWGTSTDKFAATYTDLGGGIYKIQSASTVDDEDYVEVITDGTMAYVLHDKEAMDYYVMDRNALGSAVIAFCETADEENFFGGIEVSAGHWKYFACVGGTYSFNVTITMQAGTNINAGGAIFDYGTGANKTSWKVTRGAVAATSFAIITQTNFTATDYVAAPGTDGHGTLTIGTDSDGLVFATLNGVALDGATLSADGTVLSVPNTSAAPTYDIGNAAGPMKVIATTTYTLTKIAQTYTEAEGTAMTPMFPEMTEASGTYTGELGADGHLWVWFTAPVDGKITITEDVGTSYPSTGSYNADYMVIYDTSEASESDYGNTYNGIEYDYDYTGNCEIDDLVVERGHHYVVRLGAGTDNTKTWTSTGSSYAGESVTVSWDFVPFTIETYTGPDGNIVLEKDGTEVMSLSINGKTINTYTLLGNMLSTSFDTMDLTNPADPTMTTTTGDYTLDPATFTYTGSSTPTVSHPFHALSETDTGYTGTTGNDGNIWCSFTPSKDGLMTVTETASGVGDGNLIIFEFGPNSTLSDLVYSKPYLVYDDHGISVGCTGTVTVRAGATYIIKLGSYYTRNLTIGDTTTDAGYIGATESFSFTYVDYTIETFAGADGELVLTSKDGKFLYATLGGADISGQAMLDRDNGTYTVIGQQTVDKTTDPANPTVSGSDDVYTLDFVNHTYTKTTQSYNENVVHVLDESSTGLSGRLGNDGSLWASFTPTTDGLMSIHETVQATNGNGGKDTLLAVYEATATSTWADYIYYSTSGTTSGLKALNSVTPYSSGADNGSNPVYVDYLPVQAGHTYIIKIGAYGGNSVPLGGTLSSTYTGYIGAPEAFSFSFGQIETAVYTNDSGSPLTIKTVNGELYSAALGTTAITNGTLSENGKALTVPGKTATVNTSNPLDPVATYTDTIYFLDSTTLTYEIDTESTDVHYFQTLDATTTSFTGTVGTDGNLWGVFTAPEDGVISCAETVTAASGGDGYIAVYESTATTFSSPTTNAVDYNDNGIGAGVLTAVPVQAGHTYIIKGGAFSDKDKLVGATGSSNAGNTETISFSYTGYTFNTYTGDEGDLVQKYFGENYMSATLNGAAFSATPNDDQSVYTLSNSTFDSAEMKISTTTKTYTLGEGTYETSTESNETNLLADSWTGANSGTFETLDNGSVIIAFTPDADGTYTFSVDGVTGTDVKLGLYAANFNDTGFQGNLKAVDSGSGGAGETFTYACTAGTTYYIRATFHYSDWSKAITNMTSTRGGNELTITVA